MCHASSPIIQPTREPTHAALLLSSASTKNQRVSSTISTSESSTKKSRTVMWTVKNEHSRSIGKSYFPRGVCQSGAFTIHSVHFHMRQAYVKYIAGSRTHHRRLRVIPFLAPFCSFPFPISRCLSYALPPRGLPFVRFFPRSLLEDLTLLFFAALSGLFS